MLICAMQWFISVVYTWGVKCDKVADFPKFSHIDGGIEWVAYKIHKQ